MNIIRNGKLVTPDGIRCEDIAFENGLITKIGTISEGKDDTVIDARGCYVFPGFIDEHTHLQMNTGTAWTADDFESGTRAAAAGGTTSIVDFATQDKGGTLTDALNLWKNNAKGHSHCNVAFHMAVTDWNEEVKQEIPKMIEAGVSSFKVYMAYDNLMISDPELLELLRAIREAGGICGCHCENGPVINTLQREEIARGNTGPAGHPASRPAECEAEALNRFAYLALLADCPIYIVHLSSRLGLEEVRFARKRGQTVYAETCPQYLLLEESVYHLPGFESAKYVCSPPIRKAEDVKALRQALFAGEIEALATDHCSFRYDGQKTMGKDDFRKIPNGLPGIEHRPAVLFTALREPSGLNEEDFMCFMNRVLTVGPAKLMGMYGRKGILAEGADADITIWDPRKQWTITAEDQNQNVDYTPYEGMVCTGKAREVFVNGILAAKDGTPTKEIPGTYVKRRFENGHD